MGQMVKFTPPDALGLMDVDNVIVTPFQRENTFDIIVTIFIYI